MRSLIVALFLIVLTGCSVQPDPGVETMEASSKASLERLLTEPLPVKLKDKFNAPVAHRVGGATIEAPASWSRRPVQEPGGLIALVRPGTGESLNLQSSSDSMASIGPVMSELREAGATFVRPDRMVLVSDSIGLTVRAQFDSPSGTVFTYQVIWPSDSGAYVLTAGAYDPQIAKANALRALVSWQQ